MTATDEALEDFLAAAAVAAAPKLDVQQISDLRRALRTNSQASVATLPKTSVARPRRAA